MQATNALNKIYKLIRFLINYLYVSFASLVYVLVEPRDIFLALHFLFNYLIILLLLLLLLLVKTSAINETPESREKNNRCKRRIDASKSDMFFSVH